MKGDIQLARDILAARTTIPASMTACFDGSGAPVVLTPQQAKQFGLVEDIYELAIPDGEANAVRVWFP
jgi:hypothetical protein